MSLKKHAVTIRHSTGFTELDEVLGDLVSRVREILPDNLVGLCMQGSIAVGDFDEHSDADFVVVTVEELTERQVVDLQAMHARIFDCGKEWAKHLEGSYFPKAVLRNLSSAGGKLWYLDNGHRQMERSRHCNTIVVRWIVRERGVTLVGPDPTTLIDPIPAATLQREIGEEIRSWCREILENQDRYRNRFYQGFIVLNLSRMLHDYRMGCISSKRTGADWAKEILDPSWSDLIDAWNGRPDPARSVREPADPEDFRRTLDFVRLILEETGNGACGP